MKFQIITPERVVFSDEVDQVSLMTTTGEITILPHHIPLVTVLKPGELRYKKDNEEQAIAVSGGFAEVKRDSSLTILADTAERATEIDLTRAEAARDRALKTMQEGIHADHAQFALLQASLEKALNRLKVGNKYRRLP
jgi:F-type H+-transporting ATPase subunit epsilon